MDINKETRTTLPLRKRDTVRYMQLPYNPKLTLYAKALRKAGNYAEVIFWSQVRNKQFLGLDFDRQKIIGNYIVDFFNANYFVIIEIDGDSHIGKEKEDAQRQAYLESLGLVVIRFTDLEIKNDLDNVMRYLEKCFALEADIYPPPSHTS
ncbi:endonuclease domain-containing protein [Myroides sp. N17-2]|uniref:endonuclease domain-containing protein n=1 Tax=Myroides sp. N17-2 TaxID=2030799 RepID=UPI001C1F9E40|nr:endonuclease domain-containing protein [Myroides sp. N17-2]